jgi:hypothetical protein
MRSKLIGLLLGCGLIAATAAPAFACWFKTNEAANAPPQQSAQAERSSDSQ